MDTQDVVEELILKRGLKVRREMTDARGKMGVTVFAVPPQVFGHVSNSEISILWEGTKVSVSYIKNSFPRQLAVDLHEPNSIQRIEQFLDEFSCLI